MKKFLTIIALLTITNSLYSQTVKRIKDPHIVGQEKRQVFYQWGDWQPKPKYFLGIQTSVNHALVWGWMAPERNQRYRKGSDIRPLAPAGLQNQRYASLLVQESKAKEINEDVKNVLNETIDEYYHISSLTSQADPLYILYYKKMLEPLQTFNPNINNAINWGFSNNEAYTRAIKYGLLEESKKKIAVLKNRYDLALNADMPRGKRILLYHDILKEWRKINRYIAYLNNQGKNQLNAQKKLERYEQMKKGGTISRERRDAEIFMDVVFSRK